MNKNQMLTHIYDYINNNREYVQQVEMAELV